MLYLPRRRLYVPRRRPFSRWPAPLDTLNGHLKRHPTTGRLLRMVGAAKHLASGCPRQVVDCEHCPDDIAPRCVRVTFSGVTICPGCVFDNSTHFGTFGTYDCVFSGTVGSCGYHDNTEDFGYQRWDAEFCSGNVIEQEFGAVSAGYGPTGTGDGWVASAATELNPKRYYYFAGHFDIANCEEPVTISNEYTSAQCGNTTGDGHIGGYGGTCTLTPLFAGCP